LPHFPENWQSDTKTGDLRRDRRIGQETKRRFPEWRKSGSKSRRACIDGFTKGKRSLPLPEQGGSDAASDGNQALADGEVQSQGEGGERLLQKEDVRCQLPWPVRVADG